MCFLFGIDFLSRIYELYYSERALLPPHEFHRLCGDSEVRVSQWSRGGIVLTSKSPPVTETKIEAVKQMPTRQFIFRSPIKGLLSFRLSDFL